MKTSEILRAAKKLIESRDCRFICNAISGIPVATVEEKDKAEKRVRDYIGENNTYFSYALTNIIPISYNLADCDFMQYSRAKLCEFLAIECEREGD